jgi:hypothetical protein
MPPIEREERSALSGLLTVMQADRKALEALENLIICPNTLWPLPILKLRSGPQTALKSLTAAPFLSKGGPGRKEVHAMYELLCKNRNPEPSDGEIDASYNAVAKIFNEARAEVNSASKRAAKRGNWQTGVAQLISKGMVRRAHFRVLLSAEILRNVGFGVQELLDLAFSAVELKAGGFTATKELKRLDHRICWTDLCIAIHSNSSCRVTCCYAHASRRSVLTALTCYPSIHISGKMRARACVRACRARSLRKALSNATSMSTVLVENSRSCCCKYRLTQPKAPLSSGVQSKQ